MSFFKWINKYLWKDAEPLPEKDPNDFTKTKSSTDWESDYYCPKCYKSVTTRQTLGHICPHCGECYFYCFDFKERSRRHIWFKNEWMEQFRYQNGNIEVKNKNNEMVFGLIDIRKEKV